MTRRAPAVDPCIYADRLDLSLPGEQLREQAARLIAEAVHAANGRTIEIRACRNGCGKTFRVGSMAYGCFGRNQVYCSLPCQQSAFHKARKRAKNKKRKR